MPTISNIVMYGVFLCFISFKMAFVSYTKRGSWEHKYYWTSSKDGSLLKLDNDLTWQADTILKMVIGEDGCYDGS